MPAPYGITDAGFSRKTLAEARTELEADYRATFGNSINVNPESRFGQLIGITAEREAALWELLEAIYNAAYPDGATGSSLDNVLGLTGTVREGATPSSAEVVAAGTPGTVLLAGRVFQVENGGAKFESDADATIAAVDAYPAGVSTPFVAGERVENDGEIYEATADGATSGAGAGPTGNGQAIADGTVVWRWIGTGTGAVDVAVTAQETGALPAPAMTLAVIVTAVAGLNTVRNLEDADLGTELETDAAARLRREAELRRPGNSALEAIRAAVLDVEGVTEATVFENDTMATDVNGLPPKSIEVLVSGGEDQAIADAIFGSKAAGIETFGTTTGTLVTDAQGNEHEVNFSRPVEVDVWVRVDVKTTDEFPSDGEDQIREAIVTYWQGVRRAGKNVVASQISAQAQAIDGVDEVELVYLGEADPPVSGATLAIDFRELADLDTSRIAVNVSAATP